MSGAIKTIAALEEVIGKTPPQMQLKVIDHLDAGARSWLADSPLMFAGFGDPNGMRITLAGGATGFAEGEVKTLSLPIAAIDDLSLAKPGLSFASLFLIPGIRETLRINGRVASVDEGAVHIAVEECYGHCAKALIRSDFWNAEAAGAPDEAAAFAAASRFIALATIGADGRADISPKGDPAGYTTRLDGGVVWFSDRPGNRRVDSFRNIVDQPKMAMALLIPGSTYVALVEGDAQLTTDATERARFTVQEKVPLLAVSVRTHTVEVHESSALARANVWPVRAQSTLDASKLFVEHVKLNRSGGVAGKLARASLSVPGAAEMLKKGLEKDYKENLY